MPSPFPGMDPWLENPNRWRGFHLSCLSRMKSQLNQKLRPKYIALSEDRVYISDESNVQLGSVFPDADLAETALDGSSPGSAGPMESAVLPVEATWVLDKEVNEPYLEILDADSRSVIAVIEIVSPTNKSPGAGRDNFVRKRAQVLASRSHWVEIDLLRAGERSAKTSPRPRSDDCAIVSRAGMPPRVTVWPIPLTERLPSIQIPLQPGDADVVLDLQLLVDEAFAECAFDLVIDYTVDPVPPLTAAQRVWANQRLSRSGLPRGS